MECDLSVTAFSRSAVVVSVLLTAFKATVRQHVLLPTASHFLLFLVHCHKSTQPILHLAIALRLTLFSRGANQKERKPFRKRRNLPHAAFVVATIAVVVVVEDDVCYLILTVSSLCTRLRYNSIYCAAFAGPNQWKALQKEGSLDFCPNDVAWKRLFRRDRGELTRLSNADRDISLRNITTRST